MLKYGLYRILGNDLFPRHAKIQTVNNLRFILDREICPEGVTKIFLLNRIADYEKEAQLVEMITEAGHLVISMGFSLSLYSQLDTLIMKQHYLTNVNVARNLCLADGIERGFDYILPLDGGSFFTQRGWTEFDTIVRCNSDPYFAIGQCRVSNYGEMDYVDNRPIIMEAYKFPGGVEKIGIREYALAFSPTADCKFNENLLYGNVDKVELLWRLGLFGIWDHWEPKIREQVLLTRKSTYYGTVKKAGFVVRLPSGNPQADTDNMLRGRARAEGLDLLVKEIGQSIASQR